MPEQPRTMISRIKAYLNKPGLAYDEMKSPRDAYNLWAKHYDDQPNNLVLAQEEQLFTDFIDRMNITGALVIDVGCGTGRHWNRILEKNPKHLYGFDISTGMLEQLRLKFPNASAIQQTDHRLLGVDDRSCDVILSTLALSHMENFQFVFDEWNRVLKVGGEILITDYHPEALLLGSYRTFRNGSRLMAVESHAHPISKLKKTAADLCMEVIESQEKFIDNSMKPFYQKENALHIFERFHGLPLLYALLLKKIA